MSHYRFPEHPLCHRILAALGPMGALSFAELSRAIDAPYAELNAGTLLLKEGGWIASEVSLVGQRLRMNYRLTWEGRAALANTAGRAASDGRTANVA